MKTGNSRIAILTALLAGSLAAQSAQSPASLTVNVKQPKAAVSPILYGLMTEEINYSYDGGLYAELIRNRTFRSDWTGVLYWYTVEKGNASAKITVEEKDGPSAALKNCAKLEVTKADASNRAGILNEGYWGMAVRPNTTYKGSLYAKSAAEAALPLRVALVNDQTGATLATGSLTVTGAAWKEYTFELKSGAAPASANNHFEITVDRPAALWFQLVSLFPPTYNNRTNGNRPDLMKKLAAMKPKFLRFPGGNYLEGGSLANRFDWKKMIGPLVDRPTHPTTWSYHSSDGLGLLEFLQWCEDLKMEPVLGVFAGYTLDNKVIKPGPDLDPYVQEALEEIEFVTGGVDTKWGAVRAKYGHPEPFKLRFVEVGNEDNFDRAKTYDGRYAQFYKAIKTKYPDLQIIATMPVNGMTPDVIDDHYYKREEGMFEEAKHYDKTDRKGPKIFVGEWATREGEPTPNLGAALGDAAFMTGMERNSDIVIMSAYAPLLVNVNPGGMQWTSDLIGYDALTSYGSPSYYAQVMFSSCLGDHVMDSSLAGANPKFFYSATASTTKACIKLVNASSTPQPLTLKFPGLGSGERTAKLSTMKAPSLRSTNTISAPTRVVPVSSTLKLTGENTPYVAPPYSVQVLEVELR